MEDYDPLRETRKPEFPKELKNMGIDKEAIQNETVESNEPEKTEEVVVEEKKEEKQQELIKDNSEEYDKKFKLINERLDSMEGRMDNIVQKTNSALTDFFQELSSLKKNINGAHRSQSEVTPAETKPEEKKERKPTDDLQPGDIKIEDYFNFSNKKV